MDGEQHFGDTKKYLYFRCGRCRIECKGMRYCDNETKANGSPVSTQEEIDTKFNAFKEAKKRRNRKAETGSVMHMIDSDAIAEDDESPDRSNVALDESPNDNNRTYE